MASGVVEFRFHYDIGSMYSYFAFQTLKNYLLQKGRGAAILCSSCNQSSLGCHVPFRGDGIWSCARVCLCPVLVGGIFKQTGNQPPASLPAKAAYTMKDTERLADELHIACSIPPIFPINSLQVMRLLTSVGIYEPDSLWTATQHCFQAYWGAHLDIQDPSVLEQILSNSLTPSKARHIIAKSQEQKVKDCLKATTDAAADGGAFGVPWFSIPSHPVVTLDSSRVVENVRKTQNQAHLPPLPSGASETDDMVECYFGVDRLYQLAHRLKLPWYGLNPHDVTGKQVHKL
eukprot:GHVS01071261.1.p1 GENE.GHVS01071261.1~~GHVS01071261.1.p1  ORF type:complete len:288 (-),score=27.43 GHVS01071261.1:201-1064(-)